MPPANDPPACADVTIRRALPTDLACVADFNCRLARESEALELDPETIRRGVERALSDSSIARYYLAESEGEPVAQTMITVEWSDWRNGFFWWIQSVYVVASHRRRGIFRSLFRHIMEEAREHADVRGLRLYVHDENSKALATYRDLGMTVTEYELCELVW